MKRRLEGMLDGVKVGFVGEKKITGGTRNRYLVHNLIETDKEYRQGFYTGWSSIPLACIFIMIPAVSLTVYGVAYLIEHYLK